jgi:hypothetical protein
MTCRASVIGKPLWKAEDRIDRGMARRQWGEHYGGNVGDHLDPAIPKADAATVSTAGEDVKKYMDTNIAHASADPVARQVTIKVDGVHQAMDTLAEVFRRYYGLFTPSTLATLTPTLQQDFLPGSASLGCARVRAAVGPVLRR